MSKYSILFLLLILVFSWQNTNAQEYYWVSFSDKNNSEYSLNAPEDYLSERAIQRRSNQNIPIDSLDLPVNLNYINEVVDLGVEFIHSSKWLNGITVKVEIDSFIQKVQKLPFVKEVQLTKFSSSTKSGISKFIESGIMENPAIDTSIYGESVYQTGLMNGQFLHNKNYNGDGMQIAILDAGFYNADKYFAFDSLWANNQILGTKDFVNPEDDFYSTHYHGMSVLSCMGGNIPGELIGTARKASYWLLRSEDVSSEFLIEEDNWVAAAEFADSVGADIINSSLGYYEFDDPQMNHTYADMDGKTTRVTQGANIAASRGMLVFISAGNEGNDPWKHIIAPSDGTGVIAVGAVGRDSIPAYFTSHGPAYGGAVKPNVSGVGYNTFLQKSIGDLGYSSGTSFSSPVVAGMAACMWQSVRHVTAADLKNAIEINAHLYNSPDPRSGYGIPDFEKTWWYYFPLNVPIIQTEKQWSVYPNPLSDIIVLQKENGQLKGNIEIEIYSMEGRLLKKWLKPDSNRIELSNIQSLPTGVLLMKVNSANYSETIKLSKIR